MREEVVILSIAIIIVYSNKDPDGFIGFNCQNLRFIPVTIPYVHCTSDIASEREQIFSFCLNFYFTLTCQKYLVLTGKYNENIFIKM